MILSSILILSQGDFDKIQLFEKINDKSTKLLFLGLLDKVKNNQMTKLQVDTKLRKLDLSMSRMFKLQKNQSNKRRTMTSI